MILDGEVLKLIINLILLTGVAILNGICNICRYHYLVYKAQGNVDKLRIAARSIYTRSVINLVTYVAFVTGFIYFSPMWE